MSGAPHHRSGNLFASACWALCATINGISLGLKVSAHDIVAIGLFGTLIALCLFLCLAHMPREDA